VPRRRTRSQLPSCSAVIASPSASSESSRAIAGGQVRLRQRLLLECSEPGVRLAGRPRCRATQQRAPPTRGGQAVAAALDLARCQVPAGAYRRQRARVAHTTGLSVSSRWCWCSCARCAGERSGSPLDDTLSQCELPHSRGTLAHYSYTHCCAYTCRAVRASLFLLDETIEDVSASQI
jgi:hypothetical protein